MSKHSVLRNTTPRTKPPSKPRPHDEYDPPWKEMIGDYFADFLAMFFPLAHGDIDWSRSYETLDKELHKIVREAGVGRRIADKLIKVWLKDGQQQYVLIHIEIQGKKEDSFGQRMFVYNYNYRTFDVYRRRDPNQPPEVVSFAILADPDEKWDPTGYHYGRWGSRMGLEFPTEKLWEYNDRWAELEEDPNPFATVVMAYLRARETRKKPEERLRWKNQLIRQLYGRGFERQKILDLFRFIDWVMRLPEELEERFWNEHETYETEHGMKYVTSVERIGIRKGMEKGIQKGMEKGIQKGQFSLFKRQLIHRFSEIPVWVESRIAEATQDEVEKWSLRLLDANSLEDVFVAV